MRHVYLGHLVRATKVAVVLAVAVLVGLAAVIASALLGHEVLVLLYGEDLSGIDDTLPMITAVWASYLVGIVAGLVVLVVGWRRFVRGSAAVPGSRRAD
jgi:O-antigen/teichoic acid export membrane protein